MLKADNIQLAVVTAVFACTLSACSGVKPTVADVPAVSPATRLTAERPREEAFSTVHKKELSTLNVLIEATADDLGKALNRSIRNE